MSEVLIDLRKYDLSNKLGLDMISVDALLNELANALDEIDILKEKIEDMKKLEEPDTEYDWHIIQDFKPSWWSE